MQTKGRGSKAGKRRGKRAAPEGWERPLDFAARTGLGINQIYQAVARNELAHAKVGRTILIASDALERRRDAARA